jgi:hypothetical protein
MVFFQNSDNRLMRGLGLTTEQEKSELEFTYKDRISLTSFEFIKLCFNFLIRLVKFLNC